MNYPPFCPNPDCRYHALDSASNSPSPIFRLFGTYHTKVAGTLKRFLCKGCGRTFSERAFALDYYTKKALSYQEFHRALCSGESISAMAHHQGCSIGSVLNRLDRLSRNCILLHEGQLRHLHLSEDLAADGFESFDVSQYHPNNIDLLVGSQSQFLYAFTHTTLRRKGRMTAEQKLKRAEREKRYLPKKGSAIRAFANLVGEVLPLWDRQARPHIVLKTDEHKAYPIALRSIAAIREAMDTQEFEHRTYSSKADRTIWNDLFPVNYYDRELRKDMASFHRESVCITRNVANGVGRMACYLVYHNYQKDHRIRWGAERGPKHAIVAGVEEERIEAELRSVYRERLFYKHYRVTPIWRKIWNREYETPLKKRDEYLPRYVWRETHKVR